MGRQAFFLIVLVTLGMRAMAQKSDKWLYNLLYEEGSPLLKKVLSHPDIYRYQIMYTQIDRDKFNSPYFKTYRVNVDRNRYFNPASTVKLPTALVALEKLNNLKIRELNKYSDMITDSGFRRQTKVLQDSSSESGYPSVANYIKKVFLVSDNDAYNRLYEFDGQQVLNESIWKKGYKDVRITRRFYPMNEEENRYTNPIRFYKDGKLVYEQPAVYSKVKFKFPKERILVGKAHIDANDVKVNEPMDFTHHNNFPLEDQQKILRSILFPQSVGKKERFNLTPDDYSFLYRYMSMLPGQSDHPAYDTTEYFDTYAKFFLYRATKSPVPPSVRIFSKAGWSYGFLTDNAYIVDLQNHTEFMIAATIYVNSDGIINDDKYDYDDIGYPFFKEIGEIIYHRELKRTKKYPANLSDIK